MRKIFGVLALGASVLALAGCRAAATSATPSTPPAAVSSSPVAASTPSATGTCTTGWEWDTFGPNSASGQFVAGAPGAGTASGDPVMAYQVGITNTSTVTDDVGGYGVTFWAGGQEVGSDQELATGLISPGQTLYWTVIEDHSISGDGDDPSQALAQTSAIPASATSCQFTQWSAP